MARITVEDCLTKVKNRFELVLLAAKRARLISRKGLEPLVDKKNHKATVIALKEIAKGLISPAILQQTDEEIINAASEIKANK